MVVQKQFSKLNVGVTNIKVAQEKFDKIHILFSYSKKSSLSRKKLLKLIIGIL